MTAADQHVKQKLVDTALRLFAERGRDAVSVRDIAAEAGVTHGSIRYHFGTKDKLYLAAIMQLVSVDEFFSSVPKNETDLKISPEEGEAHLRGFAHRFVNFQARIGENRLAALGMMQAELARGSGPDPVFYERVIKPGHDQMKTIISSIRPDITDDKTLEILAFNVIFQCVMIRIGQEVIKKRFGTGRLTKKDVNRIADLIVEVTLGGLRNLYH